MIRTMASSGGRSMWQAHDEDEDEDEDLDLEKETRRKRGEGERGNRMVL